MEWHDEGLVLSARPHGETAVVADILTRAHGRHLGLVYGGRSRRIRPLLLTGNHVEVTWKARLSEHLGFFTLEARRLYAAEVMDRPLALLGLQALAGLARLLPERDAYANLFEVAIFVLEFMREDDVWPALLARWELALLEDLGFGLDLGSCAVTGSAQSLIYVSPRSGRAVSADAGAPYKDRLLKLPAFLRGVGDGASPGDVLDAFALTGHFLEQRVLQPRGEAMPDARTRLVAELRGRR